MSGQGTENDTRTRAKDKKGGSAPHEIIVQRLAAEPDNKQTYQPVQPREFVNFEYEDLTLKKSCVVHFNLPASTCDILISNKGPSCSNIAQITHRKGEFDINKCREQLISTWFLQHLSCFMATVAQIKHKNIWQYLAKIGHFFENMLG